MESRLTGKPGAGLRVCVVEDEPELREELGDSLRMAGFAVRCFPGSRELYAALLDEPTDLVLLDLMLPGENGFSIAARLSALSEVGIVMLTGRNATEDRVQALLDGADAYLAKPVGLDELLATLLSVSRRSGRATKTMSTPSAQNALPGAASRAATWSLSEDGWLLHAPDASAVPLTQAERSMLMFLFDRRQQLCERKLLASVLSYPDGAYAPHRLDMLISRLRHKVVELSGMHLPLVTVRGQGFMLQLER